MGGKQSRDKGKRGEYLVRDYFRNLGFIADRVPSSGAAPGFKGDVKVTDTQGKSFLIEVKSRKKSFTSIYTLLGRESALRLAYTDRPGHLQAMLTLITISTSFDLLHVESPYFTKLAGPNRTLQRIVGMQNLLKTADYLVIKDDHQPLLFIKYGA